jgi:hypothetical protein
MPEDGLSGLPGAERVRQGLTDLAAGARSAEALLVAIAAPRLRELGLPVPPDAGLPAGAELALYGLLRAEGGDAYARYNASLAEIVSFAAALEARLWRARRAAAAT